MYKHEKMEKMKKKKLRNVKKNEKNEKMKKKIQKNEKMKKMRKKGRPSLQSAIAGLRYETNILSKKTSKRHGGVFSLVGVHLRSGTGAENGYGKDIRASRHDSFHENVSCLHILQQLIPNFTSNIPRPLWHDASSPGLLPSLP